MGANLISPNYQFSERELANYRARGLDPYQFSSKPITPVPTPTPTPAPAAQPQQAAPAIAQQPQAAPVQPVTAAPPAQAATLTLSTAPGSAGIGQPQAVAAPQAAPQAATQPTALHGASNAREQAIANAGYTGQFGAGGADQWLMQNYGTTATPTALPPSVNTSDNFNFTQALQQMLAPQQSTNSVSDFFSQLLGLPSPTPTATAAPTYSRLPTPTLPTDSPDLQGLDQLQQLSAIATRGVMGQGTSREDENYFLNNLQRSLVGDDGTVGKFNINPIEKNYLQMLGLPWQSETDFLSALQNMYAQRNAPLY